MKTDAEDVNIVIVKAVPTVKCIKKSFSIFNVSNIKKRHGTEINPPPIPNNPAKKPTAVAAKTISKIKYQYSFIKSDKDNGTLLLIYIKIFNEGPNRN